MSELYHSELGRRPNRAACSHSLSFVLCGRRGQFSVPMIMSVITVRPDRSEIPLGVYALRHPQTNPLFCYRLADLG